MSSFESNETFRDVNNIEGSYVDDLEDMIWECPNLNSCVLSENIYEVKNELSKITLDEGLKRYERLHDCEVSIEIASKLKKEENLRYTNWIKLTENQKLKLLNEVESIQAELQCRNKLNVEFEDLPEKTFGYHDAYTNKIVLNRTYVLSTQPFFHREVIDTIIHEGRHAYQHYNVDVCTVHESDAEVSSWRENFYDPKYGYYQTQGLKMYIPMKDGSIKEISDSRLYEYQPVEIDARNFASDVLSELEKSGFFEANIKV